MASMRADWQVQLSVLAGIARGQQVIADAINTYIRDLF